MSHSTSAAPVTTGHVDKADAGYSKHLKNRHIQMIGIGGAIGSGLFVGSAGRLHTAGPSLIFSYLICGIVAMIVVRALGEMVLHRPSSGAFVSYAQEFIGPHAAFAAGWFHFLNWAFTIIADSTAIALLLSYWTPLAAVPQWVLALIALVVVLTINLIGVKLFGELEFWLSIIKVSTIILFMLVAIFFIVTHQDLSGNGMHATAGLHNIDLSGGFFPNGVPPMFQLMTGIIFAYAAMELIGVAAGESENPQEIMPKAVRSVIWRILVFYIGTITLMTLLLPTDQYTKGTSPFVTVLDRVGFHIGSVTMADIMNVVLISAVASSMNSGLYSTGRVLRTLAVAKTAPGYLAKMNSNNVPAAAILTTALFGAAGVAINYFWPSQAFEIVLEMATLGIIGVWCMILLSHMAMVRKFKREGIARPDFKLGGAPVLNIFGIVFLLGILVLIGIDPSGSESSFAVRIGAPVVAAILIGTWFLIRDRVNTDAFDSDMV